MSTTRRTRALAAGSGKPAPANDLQSPPAAPFAAPSAPTSARPNRFFEVSDKRLESFWSNALRSRRTLLTQILALAPLESAGAGVNKIIDSFVDGCLSPDYLIAARRRARIAYVIGTTATIAAPVAMYTGLVLAWLKGWSPENFDHAFWAAVGAYAVASSVIAVLIMSEWGRSSSIISTGLIFRDPEVMLTRRSGYARMLLDLCRTMAVLPAVVVWLYRRRLFIELSSRGWPDPLFRHRRELYFKRSFAVAERRVLRLWWRMERVCQESV